MQIFKNLMNELKNFVSMLLLAVVVFCLSGCASDGGFMSGGDYATYSSTMTAHSQSEASRITAQSAAIQSTAMAAQTATPTESAMLSIIAMMQIERLTPVPLVIAKPTTGYDVLAKLVDQVPIVSTGAFMYRLGKVGIENAGQISVGQGANVTDSLNRPSVTTLGSNSSTTYTGTAPAQVVNPVVVDSAALAAVSTP